MKSKAAVVALCVCVILAILGVVLGKSPALENTELPPSVSEKILSSQEISSESEVSSAEVSTHAKTMTPKEEYESMYGKPQWLVCDQTYHILRAEDGTLTTETGKAPIYTRGDFKAEVMDVHVSDTLEYGLTQEDGSFTYSVNGDCTIGFYFCNAAKLFFCKVFKGYFPLPPLALSRRYWKAKSSGFFYSVLPKSIESRICHHLSFLLNVITAWHIKPNTREKQPPPNSDAPHPAPDIVIKPPTKKIPMPRNIPTP